MRRSWPMWPGWCTVPAPSAWHGWTVEARREAIARARAIGGRVVWSWPPSARPDDGSGWGYWSEPGDAGPFLRRGERVVWES